MRRRIITIAVATLALSAGGSAAQAITAGSSAGYWGCVGSQLLDQGVCVRNPLPERLPVPSTPSVPATPSV